MTATSRPNIDICQPEMTRYRVVNRDVPKTVDGVVTRVVLHVTQADTLREDVLVHVHADALSVFVIDVNRHTNHSSVYTIQQTLPIPSPHNLIRKQRETVNPLPHHNPQRIRCLRY